MAEENKNLNSEIIDKSENIFKELSGDLNFGKEITQEKKKEKDNLYYMGVGSNILTFINTLIIIFVLILLMYSYIQKNDRAYGVTYLNPVCSFILGDIENTDENCSSISALLNDINIKIETLNQENSKKIGSIIYELYSIDNFSNSKEVSFLMYNKLTKLRPLDLLNDFDRMKNDFTRGDKKMILCQNIIMNSDLELDVSCDVYSTSWDKPVSSDGGIIGVNGNKTSTLLQGTSISAASSFLNFIENNKSYNFKIINKPKTFTSQDDKLNPPYEKKTTINIKLKYYNLNPLSL